jgi:hypothetical protein
MFSLRYKSPAVVTIWAGALGFVFCPSCDKHRADFCTAPTRGGVCTCTQLYTVSIIELMVEHSVDREAVLVSSLERNLPFYWPGSKTETSVYFTSTVDKQTRIEPHTSMFLDYSLENKGTEENICSWEIEMTGGEGKLHNRSFIICTFHLMVIRMIKPRGVSWRGGI